MFVSTTPQQVTMGRGCHQVLISLLHAISLFLIFSPWLFHTLFAVTAGLGSQLLYNPSNTLIIKAALGDRKKGASFQMPGNTDPHSFKPAHCIHKATCSSLRWFLPRPVLTIQQFTSKVCSAVLAASSYLAFFFLCCLMFVCKTIIYKLQGEGTPQYGRECWSYYCFLPPPHDN